MNTTTFVRPFATPPELADEAGIAAEKICGWIATGELRATNLATKPGGRPRWHVLRADWQAFLASRANSAQPSARAPRKKPRAPFPEYIPLD